MAREGVVPGTSPRNRSQPYTYREYRSWPEEERWELIHGEAYSMSPAPRRKHQALLGRLYGELDAFFSGQPCRPYFAPVDVFFPDAEEPLDEIKNVVQPDAFVVCDRSRLIDEGVYGAPDFIIEVLSSTTAMKDQSVKRALYEANGVREYWIVNPDTFEVFIYTLNDGSYGLPRVADLREPVAVSIFPGLSLSVRESDL